MGYLRDVDKRRTSRLEWILPLSRTRNRTTVCSYRGSYPAESQTELPLPSLFHLHIFMLAHLVSTFPRRVVPSARRAISVQVPTSPRARSRALTVSAVRTQSILHGSQEAKEVGDHEIQQHSRLVARGKYLHGIESTSHAHNEKWSNPVP